MRFHKIVIIFFFIAKLCVAQMTGSLDSSFGLNGKALFNNPKMYSGFSGLCIQSDGKILLCGNTDSVGFTRLYICRLKSNGTIDSTFAQSGHYIDKISHRSLARDIILQADGKILITGVVASTSLENMFVMRLLPNGAKDITFGSNGLFTSNIANSVANENEGFKIKILADGSILVGGTVRNSSGMPGASVFKITSSGQLDNQFGVNGIRTFHLSYYDYVNDIEYQNDGKILITGGTFSPEYTYTMRLNPNGGLDSTFAVNGKFVYTFPGNDQRCMDMMITNDKKIIVSGYYEKPDANIFVYCLDSVGNLIQSYGVNGVVDYGGNMTESAYSMVNVSNKSIIVTGLVGPASGGYDLYAVCFDSTGVQNSLFGNNGAVQYDMNISNDFFYCSAVQADGKLVMAGQSDTNFVVTRIFTQDYTGFVSRNRFDNNIIVYPNPASEQINILTAIPVVNYKLLDISGVNYTSHISYKNNTCLLDQLNEGAYILNLYFNELSPIQIKVIIRR